MEVRVGSVVAERRGSIVVVRKGCSGRRGCFGRSRLGHSRTAGGQNAKQKGRSLSGDEEDLSKRFDEGQCYTYAHSECGCGMCTFNGPVFWERRFQRSLTLSVREWAANVLGMLFCDRSGCKVKKR